MARVRSIAIFLTVLTGFSGLVYQVTWQRCLATLLGSHSEATAAVLGIFLGGLSVGYSLFGRVTRGVVSRAAARGRRPDLLRLYGAVEAGIGLWALGFFSVFRALENFSLGFSFESAGLAFAFDVLLTALMIGPPTVLMGGTIPVLTQALSESVEESTRVHAWIYGFNTAGAFVGAFCAGFFLLPGIGIRWTLIAMGLVNLVAGGGFLLLSRRGAQATSVPIAASEAPRIEGFAFYAAVALLLGFAMMALQTTFIRVGGFALGGSQFTFAMVVSVFVLCIALGSLAVSALPRIRPGHLVGCTWLLAALFFALYFALPNGPYYAHVLRTGFGTSVLDFYLYYLSAFGLILLVLLVPLGLSGASLPLLFHVLRRQVGDLGSVAGRVYSWNTVGNLLGALLGGYALLFWLDLHHVYRLAVLATALAAALVTWRIQRAPRAATGALAATALALVLAPAWRPVQLASGLFYARKALPYTYDGPTKFFAHLDYEYPFYEDDPTTSVAVRDTHEHGQMNRTIVTDGKDDSSVVYEYDTTALSGLIPCLLAERCERVFVVGYGLGGTAGELAALDSTREVVVAEIAQGVIDAAPLFDYANHAASTNPKLHVIRSDAYRALLRSHERWDAIVSMPSNPWAAGVEMLYSEEFLRAARERLAPGGVYAQWIHMHTQMDRPTFELLMRTQTEVFQHSALWMAGRPADLVLLGFDRDRLDLDQVVARASRPDFRHALEHAGVPNVSSLLVHELMPLGVPNAMDLGNRIHTVFHPVLNHSAAMAFFRGQGMDLPFSGAGQPGSIGATHSLYRQYVERRGQPDPVFRERAVTEACKRKQMVLCATLLAQWRHDSPDSPRRESFEREARAAVPPELRDYLAPDLLETLSRFYDNGWSGGTPPDLGEVRRDTGLYERFYFHGAPFQIDSLRALRQACAESHCDQTSAASGASRGSAAQSSRPASAAARRRADG